MSINKPFPLNRRQVIRGILATTAFGATTKFGTGCTPSSQSQASSNAEDKPVVMGFI